MQLAAAQLAGQTGADAGKCEKALQRTLQAGSRARHPQTGRPLFAFRLHQFLSKGDTAYVTLEDESSRHITRDYQVEQPGSDGKVLLPLAFCRECGQEYLVVWRRHRDGEFRYTARRDASVSAGGDSDGYLYVSSDMPWPRDLDTVIAERRLPDSWLEVSDRTGQDVVRPTARKYLPDPVTVDVAGRERPASGGIEAAFLPGPFRFCLRCGVSYEQVRGRDFAKLATLDQEGRSSATSLISTSIMRSLQAVPPSALDPAARKLLTFVDNRQDASLQAGHFNDFVQVTMLRGALYRAAQEASEPRRGRLVPRGHRHRGDQGARPGPRRVRAAARRGPGDAQAHRRRPAGRGEPAGLPRPGARLADHHAEPGAGRPADHRLPGPRRRRRRRGAVGEDRARAAQRASRTPAGRSARCCSTRCAGPSPSTWNASTTTSSTGSGAAARGRCAPSGRSPTSDQPRAATVVARPGRAGGARDQVSMSGRGKFGRYVKRRTWFPGLRAGDHQRRRPAGHP